MVESRRLPECDDVFRRFFGPWYRPEDLECRPYSATRPDVEAHSEPGRSAAAVSLLTAEDQVGVVEQIQEMLEAAAADWPAYLPVTEPVSLAWIEAFDRHWTRDRVADLLERSDPTDYGNDLLVTVCSFGVTLGHVLREAALQLEWLADQPYWESALLDVPRGYRINVFHWAIKRFSEYGLEDGYAAKVTKCLELIRRGWDA